MITVAKVEAVGNGLLVTMEADSFDEAASPDARRLAYEERLKHNFGTGTINAETGPYPVDGRQPTEKRAVLDGKNIQTVPPASMKYRNEFTLVAGLW